MSQRLKKKIYEIIEVASIDNLSSKMFDIFIMTLISLNVIAVILETVNSLSLRFTFFFNSFELFSVLIFSIEYLLRLWTCTVDRRFSHPVKGRIRFAFTPFALIDLIAIAPFYLPMFFPFNLRTVRALRLFRLFRLLKMGRYSESLYTLQNVIKAKKTELFIALFAIFIMLLIASSFMYFVENEMQPEAFSSIPQAMWWGVAALTTVGYGDVYPLTPAGKLFGAVISILGIGIFALPTGIIASGFIEQIQRKQEKRKICPHCGKDINEKLET